LNFARNLAVDDASFAENAVDLTRAYETFCIDQLYSLPATEQDLAIDQQAAAARDQAIQFSDDIRRRFREKTLVEGIVKHSRVEPVKGICDAILVIPCSGATTEILQHNPGSTERDNFLETFMLIRGTNSDKAYTTVAKGETSHKIEELVDRSRKPPSTRAPPSHASKSKQKATSQQLLQNVFLVHPDDTQAASGCLEQVCLPQPSRKDLLLPVLVSEYKKRDELTIAKAMNQMRTYLVSSLRFLAALGLTEEPVFGLIVNGTRGAVTMAWQKNEVCMVLHLFTITESSPVM